MNTTKRQTALEVLNDLVEEYERAIIETTTENHRGALAAHTEALMHCARLKELLTASPTESTSVTTVWVGLAPTTMEHLLANNTQFRLQYEMRSKDCGTPFLKQSDIVIELIGTELGLCLGARLFKLGEGLTRLDLPTIIITVERVKEDFARAMETLGVPDTKELLEVFVETNLVYHPL
ncbi:MAG: hypothetical protein AAB891_01585 [Patescibacteria group bacterium]